MKALDVELRNARTEQGNARTNEQKQRFDSKVKKAQEAKESADPKLRELVTLIAIANAEVSVDASRARPSPDKTTATQIENQRLSLKKLTESSLQLDGLPVGIYRLLAVSGGKEVTVMEIEVRP